MPSNVANPEGEERPRNEKQVSDGSPTNSESGEPEFQEGGYGWLVEKLFRHNLSKYPPHRNESLDDLKRAHAWLLRPRKPPRVF
jgi:hypothetical protein